MRGHPLYSKTCLQGTLMRGHPLYSKTCLQGTLMRGHPLYSKTCLQGTLMRGHPLYSKTCLQGTLWWEDTLYIVKPIFKGHSVRVHPLHSKPVFRGHCDQATFSQNGVLSAHVKEPAVKGHLSCRDTFSWIFRCLIKDRYYYITCIETNCHFITVSLYDRTW